MTIFDRVKTTSKSKGYTLVEVSRRANIGEKSIYTWKPSASYPDGITPSREIIERVAKVLSVNPDFLLGLTTDPNPISTENKSHSGFDIKDAILNGEQLSFDGKPISEKYRRVLMDILTEEDE